MSNEPQRNYSNDSRASMRIGLSLSGGGSRAIAFHLGCLRGLHKAGILNQVGTISSVSGGSVLAALYCSSDGNFEDFERRVRDILRTGLVRPAIKKFLTTTEGLKCLRSVVSNILSIPLRLAIFLTSKIIPFPEKMKIFISDRLPQRKYSRTTVLRSVLDDLFYSKMLTDIRIDRPKLIVISCELNAKAAFYFTSESVHCWRYGSSSSESLRLADAVCASAAYPALLPTLTYELEFKKEGRNRKSQVMLTDGGVYDNLGLGPFWPNRDPIISLEVPRVNNVIVCRAGYGLQISPTGSNWFSRMNSVVKSALARNENGAINRLFNLKESGTFENVVMAYLDQIDEVSAETREDILISRKDVCEYPTNFSAMRDEWIDKLSLRGEQIIAAQIEKHWR